MHVSAGRAIKQWEPARFAAAARQLVARCGATIVLTGTPEDAPLVAAVRGGLQGCPAIDVSGDLDLTAARRDPGPPRSLRHRRHRPDAPGAAVGTPIVAIFGPSDPARYAPRGPRDQVVRIDLPCSPCNRIRLPPARCVGHTPDCLALLPVAQVVDAAVAVLTTSGALHGAHAGRA